ncbi:4-hydroxy-2-oxoglutarate aldolase [Sporolactobacillus inulinus]|uniref:4-hydroxy-2-oxoglutarate aldolase n=1 Tax=Sporolactobacillus inulinus TaxID=2078 RepID=A0A4Y1ZCG4_9BACL|nr:4-hydroxy-2-oxoglutarate aldolase [Sporolactobacillus inulinus]
MMNEKLIACIQSERIVPLFRKKSQAFISALVPVLAQTGFHTVEITMESSEAAASINAIKRNDPSFFVGAGTVKPLRMLIEHWMPAQTLSSRQSSMRQ